MEKDYEKKEQLQEKELEQVVGGQVHFIESEPSSSNVVGYPDRPTLSKVIADEKR